jgi:dCMP deaminase
MNWLKYFMHIAEAVAQRSKDPTTKVGAIIVDKQNRIVSTGFNGMLAGFPETDELWHNREEKLKYVCHAEFNAILYAKQNLTECTVFVSLAPCLECTKMIAAAGIKQIYYKEARDFGNTQEAIDNIIKHSSISKIKID